jgi:hypothetical protein
VVLQFRGDVYPTPIGSGTKVYTGATATFGGASTSYNASNTPQFYVDTGGGTLTIANALLVSPATVPIGSVLWHTVNPQAAQTGGYYPAPDTSLIPPGGVNTGLVIYPGQSFQIYCVTGTTSTPGHGKFFIDIEEQAFVADYNKTRRWSPATRTPTARPRRPPGRSRSPRSTRRAEARAWQTNRRATATRRWGRRRPPPPIPRTTTAPRGSSVSWSTGA